MNTSCVWLSCHLTLLLRCQTASSLCFPSPSLSSLLICLCCCCFSVLPLAPSPLCLSLWTPVHLSYFICSIFLQFLIPCSVPPLSLLNILHFWLLSSEPVGSSIHGLHRCYAIYAKSSVVELNGKVKVMGNAQGC